MLRKTAQQRTYEFTHKSCVKNHSPSIGILTPDQTKELERFWSMWLANNPKKETTDGLYGTLCKFMLGGQLNFYDRYCELQSLKTHSLQHTQILWGDLWQQKWNEMTLSRSGPKKTTMQKSLDFFNRKQVKGKLNHIVITDTIKSEVKSLIETFSPHVINDNINLIVDFVIYFQPNFVQRLTQCSDNNSTSMAYLNARYGGNLKVIKELQEHRKYQAKTNLPNTLEYWLIRNHSLEESVRLRNAHQLQLNKRAVLVLKENPHKCHFTVDYWLAKGLTLDEATSVLGQQNTRNLDYFISKYGEDSGILKFNTMISERTISFQNKPQSEKNRINKSKGKTLEQMASRHGWEKACQIIASRTSINGRVSRESMDFFQELDEMLGSRADHSITGYKGKERWIKVNHNVYFVDYYLNGKVIEYLGSFWHADNRLFEAHEPHPVKLVNANEIWNIDTIRFDGIKSQGYSLHTVWSMDALQYRKHALDEAAKFLLGN